MKHFPLSRRDLLKVSAAGLLPSAGSASVVSKYKANKWGTPGLYPARVIAMRHSGSSLDFEMQPEPIRQMIRSGLMALTGTKDHVSAWRKFVGLGDVVGIKVNPNANEDTRSSPAVILELIDGMVKAGVDPKNIVVYERYGEILSWIKDWFPPWVQTASAAPAYTDDQTGIAGYDPEHYVDLPLFLPWQDKANPAHRRSHAATFITRRVNKLINLAVLKNHNAAGVTLALKNLSHGLTNNVNRAHPGNVNSFTTYIPAVVSMPVIRYKAVLHIIDGVHGIYESGPHGREEYNWMHKTMYFATDAVALDRVGWRVIDARRVQMGLPVSAESTPRIGQAGPLQQPQYILSAGQAGLGECRDERIDLRATVLG
ncbi:MAG TPA: DUF362 domain-containing protein [Bryobacteraceae bacterium]|nr:DUF362 domain-containing protein [Bryobacteraceae bacterium]